jgi:uroporphyrinogen decarboxylase
MCTVPELTAQVSLLPVNLLHVDAAQAFSDILTPAEPMGMELRYGKDGEPGFATPIRSEEAVEALRVPDPSETLSYRMDSIRILRRELGGRVPLLGFAGGPFTVVSYMIEGGPPGRLANTKLMMFSRPDLFGKLVDKVARFTAEYLRAQVLAGAQVITMYDTFASALSPQDYRTYAAPAIHQIVAALKPERTPIMYFTNGCSSLLEEIAATGVDVISLDWRIPLEQAIARLNARMPVQGNLEPFSLLLPPEKLEERIAVILTAGKAAPGHIFNLGDGIFPQAPVDTIIAMVDTVHRLSRRPLA